MKKHLWVLLFLSLGSLLFACSKSDTQDFYNNYANKLTATVNGSAFTATNTNPQKTGPQLTVTATAGSQMVTVAVKNYTASTGSFTVNGGSGTAIAAYNPGGGADFIGTSGTVTITKVDATTYKGGSVIEGTFSFDAVSGSTTHHVTSGNFSVFLVN